MIAQGIGPGTTLMSRGVAESLDLGIDMWAAIHRLPLYEAALDLAETFQVPRNREEKSVKGTSSPRTATAKTSAPAAATATDGVK